METSVKKYVVNPVKSYFGATLGEPVKQVSLRLREEEKVRPRKTGKNRPSLLKVVRNQPMSPDVNYTLKDVRPSSNGVALRRNIF